MVLIQSNIFSGEKVGGFEKFHGAVVDHTGTENTRVFEDVAELGENSKKFKPIMGTAIARTDGNNDYIFVMNFNNNE